MSIRILGGKAKGMQLAGPKSSLIRPTSVMLKRRLFDSIQDFTGKFFIDLCAGTGSIGIEALSRGASKVYCIDKSSQAITLLNQNKKQLIKYNLDPSDLEIIKADAVKWLSENVNKINAESLIVFFDPPYADIESYEQVYQYFAKHQLKVKLVLEGCEQKTMKLNDFLKKFPNAAKKFQQGTSFFVIYDFE